MSFINLFFLYFLPILSIPIIIHLLGRRRFKKVEFSSLKFLQNLEKDVIKKLKLRQILLLIIRTLILLLIILFFARPFWNKKSSGLIINKGETLYILLDNSHSNGELLQGQTLLAHQENKLYDLSDNINFPIILKIITTSNPDEMVNFGKVTQFEYEDAIKNHLIEHNKCKLITSLDNVLKDFEKSNELSSSIWIMSDFQNFTTESHLLSNTINKFENKRIRIVFFPDLKIRSNTVIKKITFPKQIIETGKNITLKTNIENWGKQKETPISLFFENERVVQTIIDIPDKQSKTEEFEFTPDKPGIFTGKFQIGSDNLSSDNERFFVLNIPKSINILIVNNANTETHFIEKALLAGNSSLINTHFITPAILSTENFNNYDILLFYNIDKLHKSHVNKISAFQESGKGIILIPGADCIPKNFNTFWADELGFPKWQDTKTSNNDNFLEIGTINSDHPMFTGIWTDKIKLFSSPKFFTIPYFLTGKNHKVIMSYNNNIPLLFEMNNENKKGLLFTGSISSGWSDLQLTGFFPIILQRMSLYLTNCINLSQFDIGDTLYYKSQFQLDNKIILKTPDGRKFTPAYDEKNHQYFFSETSQPGIYNLFSASKLEKSFAVNIPSAELLNDFANLEDLQKITNNSKHTGINIDDDLTLTTQKQFNIFLLILVLLLSIIETYIGRINLKTHKN